jgi:hypothetical protein
MSRKDDTIESLIAGGLIGAALGALLSKDEEKGAMIGALLGAAFSATVKANEEAQKTNVPVYVEENGKLYALEPGGNKRFIKNIQKPAAKFSNLAKLK